MADSTSTGTAADDPAAAQAMVSLLIADPDGDVLTDTQIKQFLDLEHGVVKLAAARALGVIATSETLLAKVIKDGDLATDGAKLGAELRAQAKEFRASHADDLAREAAAAEDDGYFEVVDILGPSYTYGYGGHYGVEGT